MKQPITIDFKITSWERCIIHKKDAETVLEALKNGDITDAASLYEFADPLDWETLDDVSEQMTVDENDGNATIEVYDENRDIIWDNSKLTTGMIVKFKKLHENAVIPFYANPGDAGMDVTAISKSFDEFGNVVYGTGLAIELPENHVCLIFPRSSNSKKNLILSNSVGILDSGYRGELLLKFKLLSSSRLYEIGDKVGQILILPHPKIQPVEVDELSESERGEGGFGSTGN